jgi:hypothetical protein
MQRIGFRKGAGFFMITGVSTVLGKQKTDYGLWRYGVLHSHSLRIYLLSLGISLHL